MVLDKMSKLNSLLSKFNDTTGHPEQFLDPGCLTEEFKGLVKNLYDLTITKGFKSDSALPELIVKNFDDEQIWQELELQNEKCLPHLIDKTSKLLVKKSLSLPIQTLHEDELSKRPASSRVGDNSGELKEDNSEDDNVSDLAGDEDFMSGSEDENDVGSEDYDLFDENLTGSEDDEERPKYNDFFDDPPVKDDGSGNYAPNFELDCPSDLDDSAIKKEGKKVRFNQDLFNSEDEDDSDEKTVEESKSSFEKRESKLREKIAKLEEEALKEKPWQLKGEVNSEVRPLNSLLEEVVEFDMTQRPAPIITEETTNSLEEIIKRRIRDQAFDDVERKIKPVQTPHEFKKQLVLDQEKSKLSLAEVYEQEYLKQKNSQDAKGSDVVEEEPEEHKTIRQKMKWLFQKLDCLSDFYFVPRHVEPELQVVNNQKATTLEEVAPVASTDAKLLAPEEVAGQFRNSLIGKDERSKTDKKRERRKKKVLQATKFKQQEERNAGKPKTYSEELKRVTKFKNVTKLEEVIGQTTKTTKEFFSKLQQQTEAKEDPQKRRKKQKNDFIAKKLKL